MIQIHGNIILSMGFNPIIKVHDSNPWQTIYQKPSSRYLHHKAQFSLATSQNPIFISNIEKPSYQWQYQKPNFHWQHQKTQFSLAISKAQFTLALFYQKSKIINTWQKYYVIIISFKR